jgi:hypothetical protein
MERLTTGLPPGFYRKDQQSANKHQPIAGQELKNSLLQSLKKSYPQES